MRRKMHKFVDRKTPRYKSEEGSVDISPKSFRLLSQNRWLAMNVHQQKKLISADTQDGQLFITSRRYDLLESHTGAVFYESYREVRPAIGGHLFQSVYDFQDIVPGHLLLVPSFTSKADDAPLQMIKLEFPAEHSYNPGVQWNVNDSAVARKDLHTGITSVTQRLALNMQ